MPRSERLPAHRVLSHLVVMQPSPWCSGWSSPASRSRSPAWPASAPRTSPTRWTSSPRSSPPRSCPSGARSSTPTAACSPRSTDGGNRVNVPLRQVSRIMVKALVSIEDYRFYEHGPLDFKGTLRAMITNQANDGVVQGGSSITQQLVKLTLIQQADTPEEQAAATDDTYARKFNELRYAAALEEKYTKDWILERYLNTAYFGDGVYGIQMAARHYFGVNAGKLKAGQAAMLAGHGEEPDRVRPDQQRGQGHRAAQRRARPDGRAQRDQPGEGRPAQGAGPRPRRPGVAATAACAPPHRSSATTSSTGCSKDQRARGQERPTERMQPAQDRRPDDPDHRRRATCRRRPTTPSAPTSSSATRRSARWPWSSRAPATSRRSPSRGRWAATSAPARPTSTTSVPAEVRRLAVLPGRVDVQGVHARRGDRAGHPAQQGLQRARVDDVQRRATSTTAPGRSQCGSAPSTIDNSTSSGRMNLYSGTRLSVNTFYMQLEQETGICEPYELAKSMGVDLTNPNGDRNGNGAELVPTFTLGVATRQPAGDGRGLRDVRGPRPALPLPAGHRDPRLRGQPDPRVRLPVRPGDAAVHRRRGQRRARAASSRAASPSAQALDQPAAGKTGTTQRGQVGLVRRLHPAARRRRDDRRRQRSSACRSALAGQTIGGTYISSASGSGFAAPIWGDAMKRYRRLPGLRGLRLPVAPSRAPARPPPARRPSASRRSGGDGNGNGNGERQRQRQRQRRRRRRRPLGLAQLAAYLRCDGAAVGTALDLRLHDAHHLAHRLHALAGGAGLLDRGGDDGGDVLVAELPRAGSRRSPRPRRAPCRPSRRGRRRRRRSRPRGASWPRWRARR